MWNSSVSFLALPIYSLFLVCCTCINVCQMSIYLIYLKLCGFYFNATLCFQLLSITNIVYFLWRLVQAIKSFGQAHDCSHVWSPILLSARNCVVQTIKSHPYFSFESFSSLQTSQQHTVCQLKVKHDILTILTTSCERPRISLTCHRKTTPQSQRRDNASQQLTKKTCDIWITAICPPMALYVTVTLTESHM